MNFIWKCIFFWLFKICTLRALSLLHTVSMKYPFWSECFENSRKTYLVRMRSRMIRLKEQKSIFTGLSMKILMAFQSRQKSIYKLFRKYLQGFFKSSIIACCFATSWAPESPTFPTHACAFCFCLGASRLFASDTSPKAIGREGLGKLRKGTRQNNLYRSFCARGAHAAEHHG